ARKGGTSYISEAKAVAAQYGFQDGNGNIVVSVSKTATAAGCTSNCYSVTISDDVPLFLSQAVGYLGTATVNKKGATELAAGAVATSANAYTFSILPLATTALHATTSNAPPHP